MTTLLLIGTMCIVPLLVIYYLLVLMVLLTDGKTSKKLFIGLMIPFGGVFILLWELFKKCK
jgi:hypothetical protein